MVAFRVESESIAWSPEPEVPADRLLRRAAPRSTYIVLPILALANAVVVHHGPVVSGEG